MLKYLCYNFFVTREIRRNTQVWLKGPVLKTGRSRERRRGSNPFSSATFYSLSRDGAVRQLAGLITQRSLVQIQLPQPWFRGVVVITSACHAEDRGFKSRRNRHMASQLSRQSRGLKILVSLVQFPLEPPLRLIHVHLLKMCVFLYKIVSS